MHKKIIVIGCPGSGKSTFSYKLADKTHLPLYHLDLIWHKPDKTTVDKGVFDAALKEIMSNEKWIIDGNYLRTLEMRLEKCDTVFFFDLATDVCLEGVMSRIGKKRDDLPWIETKLDEEFVSEIKNFAANKRPVIYDLLQKYRAGRDIYIFRSRDEADKYFVDTFA